MLATHKILTEKDRPNLVVYQGFRLQIAGQKKEKSHFSGNSNISFLLKTQELAGETEAGIIHDKDQN